MSGAGRVQVTSESVEAAAISLYALAKPAHAGQSGWDEMIPEWQEIYRGEARTALEAAAPYLIAFPMGMTKDEWEKYVRSYR